MPHLDKLKAAFKSCRGPYSWTDFVAMIEQMGYEQLKRGSTGGSRRKYRHPESKHKILCHEPHDGEMGPKFVREMQETLEREGLL